MGLLSDTDETAKVLYYGHHGSGKTSNMAALAKLGKIWYIDAESGLKQRPLRALGIPTENIEVKRPRRYDEYEEVYWDLKEVLEKDKEPVIGLSLDSYTEFQAQMVGEARHRRVTKNIAKGKKDENIDPFFTDRDDYAKWTTQARDLTRMFRDLPIHVSMGALQRRDVSTGPLLLTPDLSEKFRNDLMGYVDMVCSTVIAESKYALDPEGIEYLGIFRNVKQFVGKDRFKCTPVVLSNPSMDRIVALLNDELDLKKDPAQKAYLKRMAEKGPQPNPPAAASNDEGVAADAD